MRSHFPDRSQLIVTLLFAVPLAALGFRVASWWGVLVGMLVGSVLASRLLMRGSADAEPTAVIFAAPVADRSPAGVAPDRPLLH